MKIKPEEIEIYLDIIKPLMKYEPILKMDSYKQHGQTSCLRHCLAVSFYSFVLCRRLHIRFDTAALIRGAMLHDFFLYDWHKPADSRRWHGFIHPKIALKNAEKHFDLSKRERDIIAKHMWPLTLRFPRFREALIVCLVDKICSVAEMLEAFPGYRFYTTLPAISSNG
ncbi:MAG: phosphohydrolase [Oscillospiraceae bacterium]|nr:phosphohydrolase [Oscillospiraceae bacterium]MDD4413578.1 phosphohydrolase [Oscillospiraceae bacterium]